jgi:pimeloyl-ACP methyl ester carboxylesterase
VTTFERLADVVDGFAHALELEHYGLYVFDFGAPVGFRRATRHPERVDALIVQNGNAYEAGIGPNLAGLAPYWEDREAAEPAARTFLQLDATRAQCIEGVADPERLNPDLWTLDQHFLDLPGRDQVMLDLFYDYTSNVALYPMWQSYLREQRPPPWSPGAPMTSISSPTELAPPWPTCQTQNFIYSTPATSRWRPMRRRSRT